jgi:hypothetical protein
MAAMRRCLHDPGGGQKEPEVVPPRADGRGSPRRQSCGAAILLSELWSGLHNYFLSTSDSSSGPSAHLPSGSLPARR